MKWQKKIAELLSLKVSGSFYLMQHCIIQFEGTGDASANRTVKKTKTRIASAESKHRRHRQRESLLRETAKESLEEGT